MIDAAAVGGKHAAGRHRDGNRKSETLKSKGTVMTNRTDRREFLESFGATDDEVKKGHRQVADGKIRERG